MTVVAQQCQKEVQAGSTPESLGVHGIVGPHVVKEVRP